MTKSFFDEGGRASGGSYDRREGPGLFPAHSGSEPEDGGLPAGLWFGGDLKACWKGVYDGFSVARLKQEEDDLWAERERLAECETRDLRAQDAVRLRIALVEDRLRALLGQYS